MRRSHLRLKGKMSGNCGVVTKCGGEVMVMEVVVTTNAERLVAPGLCLRVYHDGTWRLAMIEKLSAVGDGPFMPDRCLASGALDTARVRIGEAAKQSG